MESGNEDPQSYRLSDPATFQREIVRALPALQRHAVMMVGNLDDGADIVQECLLQAWKSRGGFRGESQVSTWLHKICANKARDFLRRRSHRPFSLREDSVVYETKDMESIMVLLDTLGRACHVDRELYNLRHLEGLSWKEVALITGLSTGACRVRFTRLLAAVRKEFQNETA